MMFQVTTATSNLLLQYPETGMGYQVVRGDVQRQFRAPFDVHTFYALNAELLVPVNELTGLREQVRTLLRSQIHPNRIYEQVLDSAESLLGFTLLEVLPRDRAAQFLTEASTSREGGAKSQAAQSTVGRERFARFTAFRNDRRITLGKGLLPGTYATTKTDADRVSTGREAVARYALPNPEPATFRFPVDPPSGTQFQQGIVEAAYGQPGGGVEVLFGQGVASGSVSAPDVLPPG